MHIHKAHNTHKCFANVFPLAKRQKSNHSDWLRKIDYEQAQPTRNNVISHFHVWYTHHSFTRKLNLSFWAFLSDVLFPMGRCDSCVAMMATMTRFRNISRLELFLNRARCRHRPTKLRCREFWEIRAFIPDLRTYLPTHRTPCFQLIVFKAFYDAREVISMTAV